MPTVSRKAFVLALLLSAALLSRPGFGQSGNSDSAFGWLQADASCPQAAYSLIGCPCSPPPPAALYVYSTKLDLSRIAGNFVSLRGSYQTGNCQVSLFQVKKATVLPPISCPCPASSALSAEPAASAITQMRCAP